jgi:acylphosphatase
VQGVGFRWFVAERARTQRVTGRVWNRADGGVEAEGQGSREALLAWLEDLRRGPVGARVEDVRETWEPDGPGREGFEIVG